MIDDSLKKIALVCYRHAEESLAILKKLIQLDVLPAPGDVLVSSVSFARRSDALAALEHMTHEGVFSQKEGIYYCSRFKGELEIVYALVSGMVLAPKDSLDENLKIVLTLPKSPNRLEGSVRSFGPQTGLIQKTEEVFEYLASQTKRSLIVMTPFLDNSGANFLLRLFSRMQEGLEKKLILRFVSLGPSNSKYPSGYLAIRDELRDMGVEVYDYSIRREGSNMLETFHAKAILSDNKQAYIGSSNFDQYSLENSMELGTFISGEPVMLVANIIKGVLAISARVN